MTSLGVRVTSQTINDQSQCFLAASKTWQATHSDLQSPTIATEFSETAKKSAVSAKFKLRL